MSSIAEWTQSWAKNAGLNTEFFRTVDSTNTAAKAAPKTGKFLFVTDHQTAGRGRGSNTWTDAAPGTCLLSSWCFELRSSVQPIASPLIGLALYEAVEAVWPGLDWSVKAPNDLYLMDKKVAGLLLESVSSGSNHRFIVGLGFNVLAHPDVASSGHLGEFVKSDVTQSDWNAFLTYWSDQLDKALERVIQPQLNFESTTKLLVALNRYPGLDRKYDEVLADGSLRIGQKQIPWTSL